LVGSKGRIELHFDHERRGAIASDPDEIRYGLIIARPTLRLDANQGSQPRLEPGQNPVRTRQGRGVPVQNPGQHLSGEILPLRNPKTVSQVGQKEPLSRVVDWNS